MQQLLHSLKTRPWFLPLVPLFFVLHGVLDNFGFIPAADALLLLGIYGTGTLVVFLMCRRYYRDTRKAALLSAGIMVVYLFFGAAHDFLLKHMPVMGKYSVLFSLLLVTFGVVGYRLKKAHLLRRPVLLLNIIFGLYVLIDTVQLGSRLIHPPANKLAILQTGNIYRPVTTAKPTIWLLVFDEYASSVSLQQQYGYHNDLDGWLQARGFSIQANSRSNYPYTPASVASILNMGFISGFKDSSTMTAKDMNYCLDLIKNNEVIRFLSGQGYVIENMSPFDLAGHPAPAAETLLPLRTKLITSNTLFSRLSRDMLWIFFKTKFGKRIADPTRGTDSLNSRLLRMLHEQAEKKRTGPAFVYGHLYMPHGPFLKDSSGRPKSLAEVIAAESLSSAVPYLNYLAYTNTEIKKLVSDILDHSGGKDAIVVMGDHGFRLHSEQNLRQNYQNLNAVYLPGGDYHRFYDSITCVNQFRMVLNSLFNQSLPQLKDSTVFLTGIQ